ncbi:exo-alpha-sialidase [Paenibacillus solisilvae]|uniref:Exo-alpha-sialidase n=1 Tax=Paenibacillus solisilvae TaxID=2486751 RepID=A0ABW0W5V2_9BACL
MVNVLVTPSANIKQEPSVAVNYLSPNIMVATATDFLNGPPATGVYRSLDGGMTWNSTILPFPAGFTGATSNVVAYAFPTTFIVAAYVFSPALNGSAVIYRSTDNGATYSAPTIAAPGYGTFTNNAEVNLTIDKAQASSFLGFVYLTYTHQVNIDIVGGSVIFFQRSVNAGVTWQTPVLISNEADYVSRSQTAVGFTGIVYVAYITLSPTVTFKVRRSLNGGVSFEPTVSVSQVDLVPTTLPVPGYAFLVLTSANIATDTSSMPTNGNVYAVWQDNRLGYADIFLSRSVNDGLTWSTPIRVTNAPAGSQNFFPSIDVSPKTGEINIIYYSNQLNGFLLDVFLSQSTDGGLNFINTRITTTSFDPNAGSAIPTASIGNYITVSVIPPSQRVAVWTDTRTGQQKIFAGP